MQAPSKSIEEVLYANPRRPGLDLEVMQLSELYRRADIEHFRPPQRPRFHLLFLFVAGQGEHVIDFRRHECRPGTVLHVRPGQVQQYLTQARAEAMVVLFSPLCVMPDEDLARRSGLASLVDHVVPAGGLHLTSEVLRWVRRDFDDLTEEYARLRGLAHEGRILRHRLSVLLLRLAGLDESGRRAEMIFSAASRAVARFEQEIERRVGQSHHVEDFAHWLACSPRTLYSNCVRMRGVGPKTLIERRVVLEAQRLLVHTSWSAERIGAELGFIEPANFTRTFKRVTGVSPAQFRAGRGTLQSGGTS